MCYNHLMPNRFIASVESLKASYFEAWLASAVCVASAVAECRLATMRQ
jgi:hypothetical protein